MPPRAFPATVKRLLGLAAVLCIVDTVDGAKVHQLDIAQAGSVRDRRGAGRIDDSVIRVARSPLLSELDSGQYEREFNP